MADELKPTEEQQAVIDASRANKDPLLISALAGAAKTSTLGMVCRALPSTMILSLAFNKRIADEMKQKLPGNVTAKTLNGVGHGVWGNAIGKRLTLDVDKSFKLLKGEIDAQSSRDRTDLYDNLGDIRKLASSAKLSGYIPEEIGRGSPLVDYEAFYEGQDDEVPPLWREVIDSALIKSVALAYQGTIDFDDQIYMPTLFGGAFPSFPVVMVDEAQDLSSINHRMLQKLAGRNRLIAVGDPYQSIYGFRGAVQSGMDSLREQFGLTDYGLSISFRCPIEVVKLARTRAPHMRYPDWAKPGLVRWHADWNAQTVPDGATIICRNNAPLLKTAFRLLQRGRGVKVVGSDIGPQLIKALEKMGEPTMSQGNVYMAIDRWEEEKLRKAKNKGAVMDKAECLRVFADQGTDLSAIVAYAKHIFAVAGPIQLMTGHKSKGGEWENVYHLDEHLIRDQKDWDHSEAVNQERNLRYVVTTRAKSELHHITTEGFDIAGI